MGDVLEYITTISSYFTHKMAEQNSNQNQNNRKRNNQKDKVEHPKKDVLLELARFQDKKIRVKYTNGRQVVGVLKGFDQLMNLVLDEVTETLRDPLDSSKMSSETRDLGLVVARGPLLLTIAPVDGMEEIENPFVQQTEESQ